MQPCAIVQSGQNYNGAVCGLANRESGNHQLDAAKPANAGPNRLRQFWSKGSPLPSRSLHAHSRFNSLVNPTQHALLYNLQLVSRFQKLTVS